MMNHDDIKSMTRTLALVQHEAAAKQPGRSQWDEAGIMVQLHNMVDQGMSPTVILEAAIAAAKAADARTPLAIIWPKYRPAAGRTTTTTGAPLETICGVCRRTRTHHDQAEAKLSQAHRHDFVPDKPRNRP